MQPLGRDHSSSVKVVMTDFTSSTAIRRASIPSRDMALSPGSFVLSAYEKGQCLGEAEQK
jgi:hypothetical protein